LPCPSTERLDFGGDLNHGWDTETLKDMQHTDCTESALFDKWQAGSITLNRGLACPNASRLSAVFACTV